MTDAGPSFHDLFGTLNGLGLQLEVLALAFACGDEVMHRRALAAARDGVATLTGQLEELRRAAAQDEEG